MKKFNETIQVSFEVDTIAEQLRSMFKDDSANADIVVEQIIGRAMTKDKTLLGKIVGAMNGHQKQVPLEIGVEYSIRPYKVWGYWTTESIARKSSVEGDITKVTVLDINPYADQEVLVQFAYPASDGSIWTKKEWISASYFSL